MADELDTKSDDEDDEDYEEDEDIMYDPTGYDEDDDEQEEDVYTSFRMFHQHVDGEEIEEEQSIQPAQSGQEKTVLDTATINNSVTTNATDEDNEDDEDNDEEGDFEDIDLNTDNNEEFPSAETVTNDLINFNITYDDLVKYVLFMEEDGTKYHEFARTCNVVFGKFRHSITRYRTNYRLRNAVTV